MVSAAPSDVPPVPLPVPASDRSPGRSPNLDRLTVPLPVPASGRSPGRSPDPAPAVPPTPTPPPAV
ncbi:hypothetical protein SSCG_06361 [Streptomyces clavuligerus]|nr:hypothetical protein SSCG_06361 [Streptomyces clavuligerus]